MTPRPLPTSSLRSAGIDQRARTHLDVVESTLRRATRFREVPAWGGVVMGLVGFAGAGAATWSESRGQWLATWLIAAAIAALIGAAEISERMAQRGTASRAQFGRFAAALAPSFVATGILTFALANAGLFGWLPSVWLLGYGTALIGGGLVSLPEVLWMGVTFDLLGLAALLTPASFGNFWLAAGFGALHVIFGTWIAGGRRG
ncbi:MAG: hypothetical protein IT453_02010 [Planctomycetes bacterium]|nr:hypothetical protein [Planctomycetota bacterium]